MNLEGTREEIKEVLLRKTISFLSKMYISKVYNIMI
jgi:hypothetical protein